MKPLDWHDEENGNTATPEFHKHHDPHSSKILIVYHSGSGGTERLCHAFSEQLSRYYQVDIIAVNDPFRRHLEDYDLVLFGFPVFHLQASPSMQEFVERLPVAERPIKAFAFCTKSTVSNNTLRRFATQLAGKNITLGGSAEFRAPGTDLVLEFPEWLTRLMHALFQMAFGYEKHINDKIQRCILTITELLETPTLQPHIPRWKVSTLFWTPVQKYVFDNFPINIAPLDILEERCISCNMCVRSCPRGGWTTENHRIPEWIASACDRCMRCVHWCPKKAIIYTESMRDRPRLTKTFHEWAQATYLGGKSSDSASTT